MSKLPPELDVLKGHQFHGFFDIAADNDGKLTSTVHFTGDDAVTPIKTDIVKTIASRSGPFTTPISSLLNISVVGPGSSFTIDEKPYNTKFTSDDDKVYTIDSNSKLIFEIGLDQKVLSSAGSGKVIQESEWNSIYKLNFKEKFDEIIVDKCIKNTAAADNFVYLINKVNLDSSDIIESVSTKKVDITNPTATATVTDIPSIEFANYGFTKKDGSYIFSGGKRKSRRRMPGYKRKRGGKNSRRHLYGPKPLFMPLKN